MSDRKLTSASFEGNSEFHKLFAAELSGASAEAKARAIEATREALEYAEKYSDSRYPEEYFKALRGFIMDIHKCLVWERGKVPQAQRERERKHIINLLARYYGVDLSAEA